ncbi:TrkH family potassium uptake protein [Salibaculum griseiflavum]|jgi:trk system potassium uptake protein TrkH|uniref:Trk system potassium uptake protein n=1 Tax=Salibaculum griseiflavum TaxID=1914409 RepID=A0A2V1P734_9RHOB|nr:TrkH family potassium uptake protein [Salibaculum griseiflavum]PWG17197.1 potassium transporter TrkH [Salibaculum griseiflavum]
MFDLRPVGYVIGLLVAALGLTMFAPLLADLVAGNGYWPVFLESGVITVMVGGLVAVACSSGVSAGLTIRQTFLLTTFVWLTLPLFGSIPFLLAIDGLSFTDAFFEAMSGLTTTGSTVLSQIEALPEGIKLWRGILQWLGGIGIIVVAMVFLPELKVGGMQIFRSEGFDTMGKILPRATEISSSISVIYVGLTLACALLYSAAGMNSFDAIIHAMTTIATGGFANYDSSFGAFGPGVEYTSVVFMMLAALPFVRYVQLISGSGAQPLFRDSQIRTFFAIAAGLVLVLAMWNWALSRELTETAFRKSLFNVVSILTGTGYASADYMQWGPFAVTLFFFIGLIGGCAGSTACSVKVFRYQLLFSAVKAQIRRIHSPHGVFSVRYQGRPVGEEVLSSVMAFFVAFMVAIGVTGVLLGMTGLDFITSVSGAATAIANVGPGLGNEIGPAGNFGGLNDTAKWILSIAMLVGRLEIMAVFTILTWHFWRA